MLLFMLLGCASVYAQEENAVLSEHSIKTSEISEFKYLLYEPDTVNKEMPLIIYLHGGSGRGDNLGLITSADGLPQYVNEKKISDIPANIPFPQVPSSHKGWAEIKVSVKELIDYICNTYNIDEERISLTGHSMGGTGTQKSGRIEPDPRKA